jgi:hypothetical protein
MWVFLALVVCVALVWRYGRYRCHLDKLRYAFWFGEEERKARGALNEARELGRGIRSEADGNLGTVRTGAEESLRPLNETLLTLQAERDTLQARALEWGDPVCDLAEQASDPPEWLQLREHVLVPVTKVESGADGAEQPEGAWGEPLALGGLHLDTEPYLDHYVCLRVTLPSGQNRVRKWLYPNSRDSVLRLAAFVRVAQEQIGKDSDFRTDLRSREAEITDRIRQTEATRASTAEPGRRGIEQAEENRTKEHARADALRDLAYAKWAKGAGHRPLW